MIHQRIVSTRPSTDVNFFVFSQEHQQFLEDFQQQGKIISRESSYSDNNLAEVIDIIFNTAEDFQEFRNSDITKNTADLRRAHNAKKGIRVTVTINQE
jgi:hypothetical protein